MRARIKVSAFTRGVTVAELLRDLLEREFPRRARRERIRFDRPHPQSKCAHGCAAAGAFDTRRPGRQRAADARGAGLHRTALQALPALRRTGAHAPARPLAALRRVPAERGSVPHPLAGQRLRHDPLAAHGDADRHAAGRRAAHPRRAAGRASAAARRRRCQRARAVLERIDGIEALGIAAADTSPAYWRTLANRLAARSALPTYTAERHAAWLAGRALP